MVVVGHGSSRADSIVKSFNVVKQCLELNLVNAIRQELAGTTNPN